MKINLENIKKRGEVFEKNDENGELNERTVAEILKNENEYFDVPKGQENLLKTAIQADDFSFEINYADEPKDPRNLPIKVFRSKEWESNNSKDKNFEHGVIYRTSAREVCREYLPKKLEDKFSAYWNLIKMKYPAMGFGKARFDTLAKKVLFDKTASNEEKREHEESSAQVEKALKELDDFKRAMLLASPQIEKSVISFQNPLIITGHDYDNPFSRKGIKDIRYITKEEISSLKQQGYDGIIFEQYEWFISFKK